MKKKKKKKKNKKNNKKKNNKKKKKKKKNKKRFSLPLVKDTVARWSQKGQRDHRRPGEPGIALNLPK